jgi:hypothetical protein
MMNPYIASAFALTLFIAAPPARGQLNHPATLDDFKHMTKRQEQIAVDAFKRYPLWFERSDGSRVTSEVDPYAKTLMRDVAICNSMTIHAITSGQVDTAQHAGYWRHRCVQTRVNEEGLDLSVQPSDER